MTFKRSQFYDVALTFARAAATRMKLHLHVAFIFGRGGALLGMATNRPGTRNSGAGYSGSTIHAERAVLKAVGDMSLLKDATLVVIRVNKQGELRLSEPCHECRCALIKAMEKYGLKQVYYS
jgi:hypothetical protein